MPAERPVLPTLGGKLTQVMQGGGGVGFRVQGEFRAGSARDAVSGVWDLVGLRGCFGFL